MEEASEVGTKVKRLHCGHCNQYLSKTQFYQHKRRYYDRHLKQWSVSHVVYSDSNAFSLTSMADSHATSSQASLPLESVFSLSDDEDGCALTFSEGQLYDAIDPEERVCTEEMQTEDDEENSDEPELVYELYTDTESNSQINEVDHQSDSYLPLLQLYTFFILMFQTLFRLSDTALNVLLSFIAMFFSTLSQTVVAIPQPFLTGLPHNLLTARRLAGTTRSRLQQYVCCPSCHSIYKHNECVIKLSNGDLESSKCKFQKFPNHPQLQHRSFCNALLMKKTKLQSGRVSLQPRLIYCYKSIIESLQELLKREGFSEKCEMWRERYAQGDNVYKDIYNGQVWKDFLEPDGIPFLSVAYNYAFQLNVDWFQPFEHTQHSEGAIYMTVMNLPRHERFLQENIILVGVIPGPKEPQLHINSFLKPLVDELQELWVGVPMKNVKDVSIMVRAALLCVGCDIPAARKVCGFVGHRALKGCSKCLLSFPTECFGEKGDYSNFNRKEWEPRTCNLHHEIAKKHLNCTTRTKQYEIERDYGIRFSVLLELPYFDAPRMCIIDPMHNLLLGTAKHMVELWKSLNILTSKDFEMIQARVDSYVCPTDVGRIPSKIASSFSGFTAEQWKNWTMFFSLFALKGILPWKHYNCWHVFVRACYLICRRTITSGQVKEADTLLNEFCVCFLQLYGPQQCNMNMHLHGHLAACITDYGPVYAFWCFAFERMNGILGSYHTNSHHISVQLANRFLDSKAYAPSNWPSEFSEEYLPLIQRFSYSKGSLMQSTIECQLSDSQLSVTPLPPIKESSFQPWELDHLIAVFDRVMEPNSFYV